jgi:hypothetical protein
MMNMTGSELRRWCDLKLHDSSKARALKVSESFPVIPFGEPAEQSIVEASPVYVWGGFFVAFGFKIICYVCF